MRPVAAFSTGNFAIMFFLSLISCNRTSMSFWYSPPLKHLNTILTRCDSLPYSYSPLIEGLHIFKRATRSAWSVRRRSSMSQLDGKAGEFADVGMPISNTRSRARTSSPLPPNCFKRWARIWGAFSIPKVCTSKAAAPVHNDSTLS